MTTTSRAETRKRGTNMSENTTTTNVDAKTIADWIVELKRNDTKARAFARKLALAAGRQAVESGRLGYANAVHEAFRQSSNSAWPTKFARFMELATGGRITAQDARGRLTVYLVPDKAACVMTDPVTFKATGDRFAWCEDAEKAKAGKRAGRDWLRASGDQLNFDELQAAKLPDGESPAIRQIKAIAKAVKSASKNREKWIGTQGSEELADIVARLENAYPAIFATVQE